MPGFFFSRTSRITPASLHPRMQVKVIRSILNNPDRQTEHTKLDRQRPGGCMTPEQAISTLKTGNQRFASGTLESPNLDEERRRKLIRDGQNPFAAVLACSDSRVPVEILFDCGLGDLFVIRVAGNVPGPTVVASLQYAIEVLKVPLIVVLGHEDCGAVGAAFAKTELPPPLIELIDMVEIGDCDNIACAVEMNVESGIRTIRETLPTVTSLESSGTLIVAGAVYSIESGEVHWLEK